MTKKEKAIKRIGSTIAGIAIFILLFNPLTIYGEQDSTLHRKKLTGFEKETWRFELNNDAFFNKDNKISSTWSLQKHSAVGRSWEGLQDVPTLVRKWGKTIPTLRGEELVYRTGTSIGQIIQTPDDLLNPDLIKEDVPYAGVLALQQGWYAFNNNEFRGFNITVGVVGPISLAEQTQKTVHILIDSPDPKGWDNQLKTEPIINLNYMRKKKIWSIGDSQNLSFDTAIDGNVGVGNLFTQASTAIEMRFGYKIPEGFIYLPQPIGFGMFHITSLKSANPAKPSFYGSLVLRASFFAYNILFDGNTFEDSHSIDKKSRVGIAIAGLHYEQKNWGVHCSVMESSDDVDTTRVPAAERNERIGSVYVDWRF